MKRTGLYKYVYDFSIDHDSIDVADILDVYKYLMRKLNIKCLDLLKNIYWIIKRFHNMNF